MNVGQVLSAMGMVLIISNIHPGVLLGETHAQEGVDFQRQIQPILSNKCFVCHGPDGQTREAGFRMDMKSSAMGPADSGEIPVVPRHPDQSELIRRIWSEGEDRMPPSDQEKQLTDVEKDLLRRWIEEGAPWDRHWAFEPLKRPSVPEVENNKWVRNPIDNFVLRQLEDAQTPTSPEAHRHTLMRRVAFDVTGLPPTTDQIDAFENDLASTAYESMVQHYFDRAEYGEHMASTWLDAARFADTNGYQNDFKRTMWPWRDWVIKAFNQKMPFDEFVIAQIAGDMLPNATQDQVIATGFNRNHRTVTEGGSIEAEWHVENVIDRVETTSTVFLGLTMGCARCHDHKYDPISQREFYQFFAFFNNVNEKGFHNEKRGNVPPLVNVMSPERERQIAKLGAQIVEATEHLETTKASVLKNWESWMTDLIRRSPSLIEKHDFGFLTGLDGDRVHNQSTLSERQGQLDDSTLGTAVAIDRERNQPLSLPSSFQFHGDRPFALSVWVKPESDGAVLSRMNSKNQYRGFDTLITDGGKVQVHLIHDWPRNGVKVTTHQRLPFSQWSHLAVTYDGSQQAAGVKIWLNGWVATTKLDSDSLSGSTLSAVPLSIGRRDHAAGYQGRLLDVRLYSRMLDRETLKAISEERIRIALDSGNSLSETQLRFARHMYLSTSPSEYSVEAEALDKLKMRLAETRKNAPTTMVMEERKQRRKTFALQRGQYDQPITDDPLEPGLPKFLPEPDYPVSNRLDLARWLVDPKNPLTARVTVNRLWAQFFGIGLVKTSENFGIQSPLPSHPELLDWLASELVDNGWDLQAIQKLILSSATYRQSSQATAAAYTRDPKNRNLARGPRFRLSAEAIRDNALSVGGLLVRQVGGPSIKPYQPEKLWSDLAGGASEGQYIQDTNENLYRRSLYIYRKRTVPHPTMTTFDGGSREVCQVARSRTNTPLQALALMNDVTYVEAARGLAVRAMASGKTTESRLAYAFRRATSRRPAQRELDVLVAAYARSLERFKRDPESAQNFLAVGELPVGEVFQSSELAAMTVVASILLNLDETITKE